METAELETREFTEVQPAISWQAILDACELVPDESMGAPWDEEDGWEHELVDDPSEGMAAGYVHSLRKAKMVRLTDADAWGNFDYFRAQGASKQVARELTAYIHRQAVEQIAKWRNEGFEWMGVTCELHGKYAGIWGIDDRKYAWEEVRLDIAREMVHELEKAGFYVYGVPVDPPARSSVSSHLAYKLRNKGENLVNAHNWKGDVFRRSKAWRKRQA